MSSPIMLIDNTDDGYLYLATMAENMKNNNDLPMLFFVMETPKQFVNIQFVKNNNIKEIYRVTGSKCKFRTLAIHYGLKKILQASGKVPGFYYVEKQDEHELRVFEPCDDIYAKFDPNSQNKYFGFEFKPCPEYNNNIGNEYTQRKFDEVRKKYNNEYTVYIAY